MVDYFVRQFPMPATVRGFVAPNDDGTFSIYINSNLDAMQQRKTLEHELKHIKKDHFYTPEKDIKAVEDEAN